MSGRPAYSYQADHTGLIDAIREMLGLSPLNGEPRTYEVERFAPTYRMDGHIEGRRARPPGAP